jgi:hypothetical protein
VRRDVEESADLPRRLKRNRRPLVAIFEGRVARRGIRLPKTCQCLDGTPSRSSREARRWRTDELLKGLEADQGHALAKPPLDPLHHRVAHAAWPSSFVGAALNPDRAVGYLAKGPFMEARVATGPGILTADDVLELPVPDGTRGYDGSARLIRGDEALDGEDVLPGFSLPLTELFGSVPNR